MRRRLAIFLGYLVTGAVISVLMTLFVLPRIGNQWGCFVKLTDADRRWWRKGAPAGFAAEPFGASMHSSMGLETRTLYEQLEANQPTLNSINVATRSLSGFPWAAFKYESWSSSQWTTREYGVWRFGSLTIPNWIIWPGMILNSVFFALILLLVIRGTRCVRGLHRLHNGRCARCAYPAGVSDRCSECGARIPAFARAEQALPLAPKLWRHRPETLIVLTLILGAAMTSGVSLLASAVAPSWPLTNLRRNDPGDRSWLMANCSNTSLDRLSIVKTRTWPGLEHLTMTTNGGVESAGYMKDATVGGWTGTCRIRAGWPMYAFEGIDWAGLTEGPRTGVQTSSDVVFIGRESTPIAIPLRPIWIGFIVDTLFYAGVLACVLYMRMRLARRGDVA